jgi:hypothetical protein
LLMTPLFLHPHPHPIVSNLKFSSHNSPISSSMSSLGPTSRGSSGSSRCCGSAACHPWPRP